MHIRNQSDTECYLRITTGLRGDYNQLKARIDMIYILAIFAMKLEPQPLPKMGKIARLFNPTKARMADAVAAKGEEGVVFKTHKDMMNYIQDTNKKGPFFVQAEGWRKSVKEYNQHVKQVKPLQTTSRVIMASLALGLVATAGAFAGAFAEKRRRDKADTNLADDSPDQDTSTGSRTQNSQIDEQLEKVPQASADINNDPNAVGKKAASDSNASLSSTAQNSQVNKQLNPGPGSSTDANKFPVTGKQPASDSNAKLDDTSDE